MVRKTIKRASLPPVKEMAEALTSLVKFQISQGELTPEEAAKRTPAKVVEGIRSRALEGPAEHVSWADLGTLAEADPTACEAGWHQHPRSTQYCGDVQLTFSHRWLLRL